MSFKIEQTGEKYRCTIFAEWGEKIHTQNFNTHSDAASYGRYYLWRTYWVR